MLAGGASSSREAAPVLALFYIEGNASAWDLPRVSAVNWKAAFNMPVRKRMQISSFSLFWVRFMPPPHAQPPGSNKSQRGRECCKETDTLQFLCAGQGDGMCGDQQLLPGITNLVQHTIPLLPSTTLEITHQNMGIYFLVIPLPSLLCQGCVCPVWDGAVNLILAEGSIRDEPFPCSVPKFSPASDGSPRTPGLGCTADLS